MQDELAACLRPLAGRAAGHDARLDAEHERVRQEVEKLSSLSGGDVDWETVEQHGHALLTSRSKDLAIAAFVAGARFERAGWQGLRDGCALLVGLVRAFGVELYPLRPRARANALAWWVDHVAPRIAKLSRLDAAPITALKQQVMDLQNAASEWLADDAPPFGELLRALDRAVEEPRAVVAVVAPPEPTPTVVEEVVPHDEPGIARYLRMQSTRLVELAQARMEADLRDARAYRWLRTGLWLGWDDAPPEARAGRTAVVAPLPSARAELELARAQRRWADVVRLSESLLAVVPHWLELGFVTAQALRELGSEYTSALVSVERETRSLHTRIPELATRSFRDGTRFASAEALPWLNAGAREQPPVPDAELSSDPKDALLAALQRAPSPRLQFKQRCQLARRYAARGESERAKLVYRGLLLDVDAFALERWEPALALEVLEPLCALSETPSGVKDGEPVDLYVRLARLAPWTAPARNTKSA